MRFLFIEPSALGRQPNVRLNSSLLNAKLLLPDQLFEFAAQRFG